MAIVDIYIERMCSDRVKPSSEVTKFLVLLFLSHQLIGQVI